MTWDADKMNLKLKVYGLDSFGDFYIGAPEGGHLAVIARREHLDAPLGATT